MINFKTSLCFKGAFGEVMKYVTKNDNKPLILKRFDEISAEVRRDFVSFKNI